MSEDQYITPEEAAALLKVTPRQARRYANGPAPRVRLLRAGNRTMLHRQDVEALALEINAAYKPARRRGEASLPAEIVEHLYKKDEQIQALQQQIREMAHTIGDLQASAEAKKHLEAELYQLRRRINYLEAKVEEKQEMIEEMLAGRRWFKKKT